MSCSITTTPNKETAWCPGCGDFGILAAIKDALEALDKKCHEVLTVGGIGQAAKLPQYISTNGLCSLHGRALPGAFAAKIANSDLTVIVTSGDGDCFGEGGNHFLHAVRRNVDITLIVHNNQIYGLTQGQGSPTSDPGFVTGLQPRGVISQPLRGPALALTLGCGFVARGFSGDIKGLSALIQKGVKHRGFSFIEVLQPCVSMNKINTFAWYKKHFKDLTEEGNHDTSDRIAALKLAETWEDVIPGGVLYEETGPSYEDKVPLLNDGPLVKQPRRDKALMEEHFKTMM